MNLSYLELLVEEPSMEPVVRALMPQIVDVPFEVRRFGGKDDLLKELPGRLRGYCGMQRHISLGVVIVLDRDDDDCLTLKQGVVDMVHAASMTTLSEGGNVAVRLADEELEAWFFGDVPALRVVHPRIPPTLDQRRAFREPDNVKGGTREALERVLQGAGYFPGGLNKGELSRTIAPHLSIAGNRSNSFNHFVSGVQRLCGKDA